jgi:hypothetical protein
MPAQNQPEKPNEPFVPQGDRPESKLNPDTPLSELRVRDLATLLGSQSQTAVLKKLEISKEFIKHEKWEKWEKWEHKFEKWEHKYEKFEHKPEPWEYITKVAPDNIPDPTGGPIPDPWQQIITEVTTLREQVSTLTEQVRKLQGGNR